MNAPTQLQEVLPQVIEFSLDGKKEIGRAHV